MMYRLIFIILLITIDLSVQHQYYSFELQTSTSDSLSVSCSQPCFIKNMKMSCQLTKAIQYDVFTIQFLNEFYQGSGCIAVQGFDWFEFNFSFSENSYELDMLGHAIDLSDIKCVSTTFSYNVTNQIQCIWDSQYTATFNFVLTPLSSNTSNWLSTLEQSSN